MCIVVAAVCLSVFSCLMSFFCISVFYLPHISLASFAYLCFIASCFSWFIFCMPISMALAT